MSIKVTILVSKSKLALLLSSRSEHTTDPSTRRLVSICLLLSCPHYTQVILPFKCSMGGFFPRSGQDENTLISSLFIFNKIHLSPIMGWNQKIQNLLCFHISKFEYINDWICCVTKCFQTRPVLRKKLYFEGEPW